MANNLQQSVLEATSILSILMSVVAFVSGAYVYHASINFSERYWIIRRILLASTLMSGVYFAVIVKWHYFVKGWSWPQWPFWQLMGFAGIDIATHIMFVVFHWGCWIAFKDEK